MYFQMCKKWSLVATICGQYLARPLNDKWLIKPKLAKKKKCAAILHLMLVKIFKCESKKRLNGTSEVKRQTNRQTNRQTDGRINL